MAQHNELGNKGEKEAIKFLQQLGYKILETNYRYIKHEVDIIAEFENQLIVVEVKTRSTRYFGDPQDFVKTTQRKSIVIAVNAFIEERDIDLEVRFDIIAVTSVKGGLEIEHIPDAFLSF